MIRLPRHRPFSGNGPGLRTHWRGAAAQSFLAACCLATILSAPAARAVSGFTGLFDPDTTTNWELSVKTGEATTQPDPPICENLADNLGCVDTSEGGPGPGGIAYIGAYWIEEIAFNNAPIVSWTWTSPVGAPPYYVSFKYEIADEPGANGYANIFINGTEITPRDWYVSDGQGTVNPIRVDSGQTVVFKVTSPIGSGAPTFLKISAFDATEVPAPLPATGAASAFAFSRRLRRKIRGETPAKIPRIPRARPASAYLASHLHLATDALSNVPMSFDYNVLRPGPGRRS